MIVDSIIVYLLHGEPCNTLALSAHWNDMADVFLTLCALNWSQLSLDRNPSLKQQLFSYAILGFALSEAMGLFCLMVAFLILFAM